MKRFLFVLLSCVICLPCYADEIEKKTELKIGLLPYVSATRLIKTFVPLKTYIESQTEYDVIFLTAPTFKKFVERTTAREYDLVFTAPHFALLAEQADKYKRMARFTRELSACVFVAADSKAKFLVDLKNKTISTPHSLAIVSVLGESMMREAGLNLNSEVAFLRTPSHNNVMLSVANHGSEAGVVAAGIFEQFTAKRRNKDKFRLLSCSEPVPAAMFIANPKMPANESAKLAKVLLDFPLSLEGRRFFSSTPFRGMESINDADMLGVEKYIKDLKVLLRTSD